MDRLPRLLQIAAQDRWGLVFYRCTYKDQPAWLKFQQTIRRTTEDFLSHSQHSLKESLEWTFVEDSNALDGTSREDLRTHFRAWRDTAAQQEQPRAKPLRARGPEGIILDPYFKNPRYHIFVQVDEDSLQSVTSSTLDRHLKFIDANWTPTAEADLVAEANGLLPYGTAEQRADEVDDLREKLEFEKSFLQPVDGCREDYVGWVKVELKFALTETYEMSWGIATDCNLLTVHDNPGWEFVYRRPPEIIHGDD